MISNVTRQLVTLKWNDNLIEPDVLHVRTEAENSTPATPLDPIGPAAVAYTGGDNAVAVPYYKGFSIGLRVVTLSKYQGAGEGVLTLQGNGVYVLDPARGSEYIQAYSAEGILSSIQISWGDGDQDTFYVPYITPISHTYAESGEYNVTVAANFLPYNELPSEPYVAPFWAYSSPSASYMISIEVP